MFELYRAADFCLVNSLHDGMNLVAKESWRRRRRRRRPALLRCIARAAGSRSDQIFDVTETFANAMKWPCEWRDERRTA